MSASSPSPISPSLDAAASALFVSPLSPSLENVRLTRNEGTVYIANEEFVKNNPTKIAAFMRAVKKAADFLQADPVQAWKEYTMSVHVLPLPRLGRP